MIIRIIVIAALAGVSFITGGILPEFGSKEKEVAIIQRVKHMLEHIHFDPKQIDDDFSQKMFDQYVEALDGNKRFLTQEDIDQLSQYRTKLDDQLKSNDLTFFTLSLELLNNSIEKTKSYYKELMEQPIDFTGMEKLELDPDKREFASNDTELKEFWRKLIKYEVLFRLNDAIEENEKKEEKKSIEELEKESREKVIKIYKDWYSRMDQLRRSDRFEIYVDAMAHGFDPHSDYFSPKGKEDFDIRMANKLEGIGARLQADGDYTKVTSIIPGGPAWKGKQLEPEDLITQVAQGEGEFVDVTGMRLDDVVQHVRGKKGTKVRLLVKKKDASMKEITIIRDEVIIEDGKARSVLMGHTNIIDSIGFISLPSFYSDFNDPNRNGCADDMAIEIEKLKEQNVKGIIIDLRNNGGGSLSEVVEMAGFFVEDGPIVQVKPREKEAFVYSDRDKGDVKYDGPLVVLVNSFSVSASEILAAALQDYKRAVIVGSKSTFGKGTVQRFWNLDQAFRSSDDLKPLGEIKITTQKFYRINGGSTQLKGVLSDVVLPDAYHYIEIGEKDLDNAMKWTKIQKREYDQNTYRVNDIAEIIKRSDKRLKADEEFELIRQQATVLKKFRDNTIMPLNLNEYQIMDEHRREVEQKFDEGLDKEIPGMLVSNLQVDMAHINMDSSRIVRNEAWLKNLAKDVYVEEALNVLKDMIEVN